MIGTRTSRTKRILWIGAIVLVVAFLAFRYCRSNRGGTIWTCRETATGCSCSGSVDPEDRRKEELCKREYECCVYKIDGAFEASSVTCDCWNPSDGGPSCESRLPKEHVWGWNRVARCQ